MRRGKERKTIPKHIRPKYDRDGKLGF